MNHLSTSALPYALGSVSYLDLAHAQPSQARVSVPALGGSRLPAPAQATARGPKTLRVDTLRYVLHQASSGASYLHLSLFDDDRELAHWVLPGGVVQSALAPPTYLVEASRPLAPTAAQILDEGSCQPVGTYRCHPLHQLEQGLRNGHLELLLRGQELQGEFSLLRLHPQGHTWELHRQQPSLLTQRLVAWA
ncbi:hypothetical protein [Hymenobacter metallicola]|uniref:Uncharacterized protein n=1 Tax=Hymenobacter metallicola TaxID=2563114 RepID=A0A4Z0QDS4_9BACT|nr:hypothetical protein [Hymenobacter metallicola]TGE28258.1 hypothetical protein E5K02_01985 [Hymenobacter metallicola]